MDKTEKLYLISRYESSIDSLLDFVRSIPAPAIDFRPNLPGAWTIREHAIHFLDAETFAYGRLRLAVAQPGVEVFAWNEIAWQEKAKYETAEAMASLEIARELRRIVGTMFRAFVDADWEAFYVRHPQRGRMTVADILKLYIDHVQFHMSYLRRNLDAFEGESRS